MGRRNKRETRREFWREFIAEAAGSDEPIRTLCARHHVRPHQYYWWRKRLTAEPAATLPTAKTIPFALVTGMPLASLNPVLELVLDEEGRRTPWRLRIGAGVDEATLAAVLAVLRR